MMRDGQEITLDGQVLMLDGQEVLVSEDISYGLSKSFDKDDPNAMIGYRYEITIQELEEGANIENGIDLADYFTHEAYLYDNVQGLELACAHGDGKEDAYKKLLQAIKHIRLRASKE